MSFSDRSTRPHSLIKIIAARLAKPGSAEGASAVVVRQRVFVVAVLYLLINVLLSSTTSASGLPYLYASTASPPRSGSASLALATMGRSTETSAPRQQAAGPVATATVRPHATAPVSAQVALSTSTPGALNWRYQTGGYVYSTPAVANGIVYAGSWDNYLYALNAGNGQVLWRYQDNAAGANGIASSAAVADGVVYASLGYGFLHALDAATGRLLWRNLTTSMDNAPPAIANGTVYFGSGDGSIYALDAATGNLQWKFDATATGNSWFNWFFETPVVVGGVVYVGAGNSNVYALNASTGTLLWRYHINTANFSAPAVVGGIVYVVSGETGVPIRALNASTGALLWRSPTGLDVFNGFAPAVWGGMVYYGAANTSVSAHYLSAFNASTGALVWQYQTSGYAIATPAVANGAIYASSQDASIYALNASTGALLWRYQTGAPIDASPAVADGTVYVGSEDHYLYALAASPPIQNPAQTVLGTERLGGSNASELRYCRACAGDPVDTYSGNFSYTVSDLQVPGRGLALNFSRTYNAGAAAQNGALGYGWADSYHWALAFDGSGNATITQENGSTVGFAPTGSGGYSAPSRVLASLVHNGDGSYTFSRAQDQTHFTFSASGQLLRETDRNGYTTSLGYDGAGHLVRVTDPAGRALTLGYDSSGRLTSVSDPLSRSVTFTFDGSGNLATATDVVGGVWRFNYDANHLLLTMTNPRGGVTTNVYDASGRVSSQMDALHRLTTFAYTAPDSNGNSSTTITDPRGNVTVDQYYNGLLLSETRGYGTAQAATWSYTYDPVSLGRASVVDPNGTVTSQTWDVSGNLLTTVDPLGRVTSSTYNSFNEVLTTTDPLGVTTTNTYDASGNLLSTARPLVGTSQVQTTSYTYGDGAHPGDVTALTDPNGRVWTLAYDANGDRTSQTDPLGDTTSWQYNAIGWPTSQTRPNGHVAGADPAAFTTQYAYTAFGDVVTVTDGLGHVTTNQYDANRNLVQTTDADGQVTHTTYDAENQPTQVTRADGTTIGTTYDVDGNVASQTDGLGHTTQDTYDPLNRLASVTDPLGHSTGYTYDGAGNRLTLLDAAGQTTSYSYDTANQLTSVRYSDNATPSVFYTYDADGQRNSMSDGTGITTYAYDSLHRLVSATDGQGATVGYAYDLRGSLTTLTYPDGQTLQRRYDAAGRLGMETDWLNHSFRFQYDADGNLTGIGYPNLVDSTRTYDSLDRLSGITDVQAPPIPPLQPLGTPTGAAQPNGAVPGILLSFQYTRDPLGLLIAAQPTKGSGTALVGENYAYTALNQVASRNGTATAYDAGDNLIQRGSASLTYNAGDELTSLTQGAATSFAYDLRGDRIQASGALTASYAYDQANRLTSAAVGGITTTYAYNGDGLRLRKTVGASAPEPFAWDTAEGLPLLLRDGTTAFVYGPGGQVLEQITGSTPLYLLADHLGSVRAITDGTGAVVTTITYDAYGSVETRTGNAATPFGYAGQYTDAETGFIYLRARSYDPATAQFLARDPLVDMTQEPYGFAAGDPVNKSDPSGLSPFPLQGSSFNPQLACSAPIMNGQSINMVGGRRFDPALAVGTPISSGRSSAQDQSIPIISGLQGAAEYVQTHYSLGGLATAVGAGCVGSSATVWVVGSAATIVTWGAAAAPSAAVLVGACGGGALSGGVLYFIYGGDQNPDNGNIIDPSSAYDAEDYLRSTLP